MHSTRMEQNARVVSPVRGAGRGRSGRGGIGFVLFLLVNAVLFIRPSEVLPALEGLHLYVVGIVGCIAIYLPAMIRQLTGREITNRPITFCVMGMLAAVGMSHLSHFAFGRLMTGGVEFAKVVLYYLLLISAVDTATRLRQFLFWLTVFIIVVAALPVLQYKGWVYYNQDMTMLKDVRVDQATGQETRFDRLRGVGIFNDPNDLASIVGAGTILCMYWMGQQKSRGRKIAWAMLIGFLAYTIMLTQSRGGFLALMAGLISLFISRYGWRKAVIWGIVSLPIMAWVFGGRQTNITTEGGTGQSRVQMWSDAMMAFRQSPLFGAGEGQFVEMAGQVAHNSFVHSYAELGFFGGTMFLGAFYLGFKELFARRLTKAQGMDGDLRGMQPYLTAMMALYIVGMMSLSRGYVVPTYTMLGLATVFVKLSGTRGERVTARLLAKLAGISAVFVIAIFVVVKMLVRWG